MNAILAIKKWKYLLFMSMLFVCFNLFLTLFILLNLGPGTTLNLEMNSIQKTNITTLHDDRGHGPVNGVIIYLIYIFSFPFWTASFDNLIFGLQRYPYIFDNFFFPIFNPAAGFQKIVFVKVSFCIILNFYDASKMVGYF